MSDERHHRTAIIVALIGAASVIVAAFLEFRPLHPPEAVASPDTAVIASCPDLGGSWQRVADRIVMEIKQTGCVLTGVLRSPGFNHALSGEFRDGRFQTTLARTNVQDGCTTNLYSYISVESPRRFFFTAYGSDGQCDLPVNFQEHFEWGRP
jgi:hypothetical protein